MLDIKCKRCKEPLDKPGALLFGVPSVSEQKCVKTHLCERCYDVVRMEIDSYHRRKRIDAKNPSDLSELRKP